MPRKSEILFLTRARGWPLSRAACLRPQDARPRLRPKKAREVALPDGRDAARLGALVAPSNRPPT
jgi:hypothetical protein